MIPVRDEILEHLRASPDGATVADVAEATGAPSTTVRFHLRGLRDDGLVEMRTAAPDGPGRPSALYYARAAMDPSGPRTYEVLAEVLVRALSAAPDTREQALAAGRQWGAERARAAADPVDDLVAVLDDFGFAPEAADDRASIRLNRCPFLELARKSPGVTCSVHRGIMQGVLSAHGPRVTLAGLDAFVSGDHCVAALSRRGEA